MVYLHMHSTNSGENGLYTVNDRDHAEKFFPCDHSLMDSMQDVSPSFRVNPAKIKSAQLSGDVFELVRRNQSALESLLQEITDLPNLIRLRIVLPSMGSDIGRLISIFRKILRQAGPKEVFVGQELVTLLGGALDIIIRVEEVGINPRNDENGLRSELLFEPLVEDILDLSTIHEFELCTPLLRGDCFQKVMNNSNLALLRLSGMPLGEFEAAVIANSINTLASSRKQGRQKRKRGQTLGSLHQLKELEISRVAIGKLELGHLLLGLKSNTTIETLHLEEVSMDPNYENQDEFWVQFLSLLRQNNMLREVEILSNEENDISDPPASLSNELEEILVHHNHSLAEIDVTIGGIRVEHSASVQGLLLLNMYKLRPFVGNEGRHSKQQILVGILGAKKILASRRKECAGKDMSAELVTSLLLVLQKNPLLLNCIDD